MLDTLWSYHKENLLLKGLRMSRCRNFHCQRSPRGVKWPDIGIGPFQQLFLNPKPKVNASASKQVESKCKQVV